MGARRGATTVVIVLAALCLATQAAAATPTVRFPGTAWSWASPQPQGSPLSDVGVEGGQAYVLDYVSGAVLHSPDAGRTWHTVPGITQGLDRVTTVGPRTLLLGKCAELLRSDDGGVTRTVVYSPPDPVTARCARAVSFADERTGLVAFDDGTILRTIDGGRTFSSLPRAPGGILSSISLVSPTHGFAVAAKGDYDRSLAETTDGGSSWTTIAPAGSFSSVTAVDDRTVYATTGTGLLRSSDGGRTFALVPVAGIGTKQSVTSVRCFSTIRCLLTITGKRNRDDVNQLALTTDGGQSAHVVPGTLAIEEVAVDGSAAVGAGSIGRLLRSSDAGSTFGAGPPNWRYSAEGRLREGRDGRLYAPADAEEGGAPDGLLRSTDRGDNWTVVPVPDPGSWNSYDVAFSDRRSGWVLQHNDNAMRRLLRTRDGGRHWGVDRRTGLKGAGALVATRSRLLIAGSRGVFERTRRGVRRLHSGPGLNDFDTGRGVIAAMGGRRALWSTDGGRHWRRLRLPAKSRLNDLAAIDRRTAVAVSDAGTFRTTDAGRHWRRLVAAGAEEAGAVEFVDRRTGWLDISGSNGFSLPAYRGAATLLRTDDGGASWRPQFDSPTEGDGISTLLGVDRRHAAFGFEGGLISTNRSGDAPRRTRLTISASRRNVTRGGSVRIAGRLSPGDGRKVIVECRTGGGWKRQLVTASGGRWSSSWRLSHRATFVAQVVGDDQISGAGTRALSVGLGR